MMNENENAVRGRTIALIVIGLVITGVLITVSGLSRRHNGQVIYGYSFVTDEAGGERLTVNGAVSTSNASGARITVNINTASAQELMLVLPGIGEIRAAAIVEYRTLNGGFRTVDELMQVEGIGEKTVESIRPYCRLDGPRVESVEIVSSGDEVSD